jgi:hypothetical protein
MCAYTVEVIARALSDGSLKARIPAALAWFLSPVIRHLSMHILSSLVPELRAKPWLTIKLPTWFAS